MAKAEMAEGLERFDPDPGGKDLHLLLLSKFHSPHLQISVKSTAFVGLLTV